MRLPKFQYLEPKTLDEAAKALVLQRKGAALPVSYTHLTLPTTPYV